MNPAFSHFRSMAVSIEIYASNQSWLIPSKRCQLPLTPNLQLFGRIENLLDKHYEEVFTFGTPGARPMEASACTSAPGTRRQVQGC